MDVKNIGDAIERMVKEAYRLDESEEGFDASYEGKPIEIKACRPIHHNGVNSNGKNRITKGRFWISNRNHQLLQDLDGIYAFVLYEPAKIMLVNLNIRWMPAFTLSSMIGEGANTKIRYNRIFEDYNLGVI